MHSNVTLEEDDSESLSPGFELPRVDVHNDGQQNENVDVDFETEGNRFFESTGQSNDSDLVEARKVWELGKSLGLSFPGEIDVIWAMVKEHKSRKGKKSQKKK